MPTGGPAQPRVMESITDAADGFDKLARIAKLLPQALDVDVDGPLQHDGVLANGRVHQLIARERPACLADQDLQQPKLGWRERKLLVLEERPVAVAINDNPLSTNQC